MAKIKPFLLGWKRCNFERYKEAYTLLGGSVSTHPNIVSFLNEKLDNELFFYIKEYGSSMVGAYFTCVNNKLAAGLQKKYPFLYDEIIFPISKDVKIIFPEKSKRLSLLHKGNIVNASYTLFNKRKICLIKDSFSYKTRRNRSNEINKFKRAGGEIRPSSEFSAEELVNIYVDLYQKRWDYNHSAEQRKHLLEMYTELREHIFGYVLLINGNPCAYDFVLRADSPKWISFDAINGGYDPEYADLSVGSILMWVNIQEAKAQCQEADKTMRYSLGNPTFEYKNRWCVTLPLGKVLF
ncbi:GNAT family N-acetyltransferase [Xenorhabdus bovienii]|uniref:GNAT family N-acetyltransferase n=1 Tax=Xenorhabdus bovienii TaxID=40576 RepID=UPI0023B2108A|nr:GNAT family N-acetyltransferase [Xenorhabdus bovienii]MDE9433309.1 GNAT family N-acetyltransferase [Xenorhabdus bovienii]MDE9490998.1 GNAT family N-acetyltransferase [Xenorhabdus bovienii]MDE9507316.1 GNAT family N-acetyltransferase [Xenorhabdus bovienii]MDE9547816.1 GNAT family N-acetyltransferase [Xenorhabdus bovienii]